MMYDNMAKLMLGDHPIKFETIIWPAEDIGFVNVQEFTVKTISNMCQIPASLMTGECLMTVDLTEASRAWLKKETEKMRRRFEEKILADLRRLEKFLEIHDTLDDLIAEMKSRRWAADYTKQFFRDRPGIRLADAINVTRN